MFVPQILGYLDRRESMPAVTAYPAAFNEVKRAGYVLILAGVYYLRWLVTRRAPHFLALFSGSSRSIATVFCRV